MLRIGRWSLEYSIFNAPYGRKQILSASVTRHQMINAAHGRHPHLMKVIFHIPPAIL